MKIKSLVNILTFTLIMSTAHARSVSQDHQSVTTIYQNMSTVQLQKEVEKHSNNGTLSFVLGQELIKRWTQG